MATYMKIDGINGNVTTKNYENWIELESANFNVVRNISTKPGKTADRETSQPSISEIQIIKKMDVTTPYLFTESCVGTAKSQVQIHLCHTGNGNVSPYMQYTLNNVLISNYSVKIGRNQENNEIENKIPLETLSLNFDRIEMKYTPYDEKNNPKSPVPAGYDLNAAQKM